MNEFCTGFIMMDCAWFVMPICDIPIATTAPPTISLDMSLIYGTPDPMPRLRRIWQDRHSCHVLPFLRRAYAILHIYRRIYSRRRRSSMDSRRPRRRIAASTGCRHNYTAARIHGNRRHCSDSRIRCYLSMATLGVEIPLGCVFSSRWMEIMIEMYCRT